MSLRRTKYAPSIHRLIGSCKSIQCSSLVIDRSLPTPLVALRIDEVEGHRPGLAAIARHLAELPHVAVAGSRERHAREGGLALRGLVGDQDHLAVGKRAD